MPQFLVQVDSPGDMPAFTQSMRDKGLGCVAASNDQNWISNVLQDRPRLVDARYVLVIADTEDSIYQAVENTASYALEKWPEGRPVFSVLALREPLSYPAKHL